MDIFLIEFRYTLVDTSMNSATRASEASWILLVCTRL